MCTFRSNCNGSGHTSTVLQGGNPTKTYYSHVDYCPVCKEYQITQRRIGDHPFCSSSSDNRDTDDMLRELLR